MEEDISGLRTSRRPNGGDVTIIFSAVKMPLIIRFS
jgi:hypothetical protein